ncbi:hypothetical protein WN944_016118 [Citrus x changshan-huyou]|uniref:B box-type domain-containing protein n=1 Tax=Citrus x changshan-huyou TaxID=2935761 RepID=A0AAP0M8T7_9ROSI
MKIQCDVCEKAPATVICCADEAALCAKCDVEVHAANKLASKHQRLLLQCLSNKLPPCDICQEKAAFIFCVEDRALFCKDCDEPIHSPGSLSANHQRFLATGIRVALSSSCSKDAERNISEPPNQQASQTSVKMPTQQSSSISSPWAVEDFLQFSDFESSGKKEQLEFGELEWIADMGIFNDQLPQEALAAAEVPQLPVSQPNNLISSYRPTKFNMPYKKPRIEIPDDDDEHFTVPDLAFAALVPTIVHSATLATDTQVLRLLKRSIDPNTIPRSSFLDSWDFKLDPCESSGGQFLGILCSIPSDNSTSRITAIYLDSSGYDGFLTPSIGNLTELTTLDLSRNNFRGPIPDTVTGLRKLTTLSLPGNFFTGNIPVGITRLKKLQTLDLSHNSLSGIIPAQLSGLRSLTALRLSHNAFSGKIPSLTGAWQLHTLDLDSNQLYGNLPKFPTSLRTLSLSHNLLSGHLSSLRNLVNLKSLDLSSNRFTGAISHEVLTLPQVVSIDVSVNRLTAIEMTTLSGDTHLQELDVQGNLLRGHLPINLVSLRNLTSINLARNQLSGHIPKVYGAKLGSSWRSLFLDHNFLWGNLPPEFSSSITRIRGSLAKNCLSCPETIRLCHGGQRPASECVGQNDKE